jgi:UDP-glucose 4-epimerase
MTVKELWDAFREISGDVETAKQMPAREGDIKASLSDISKIQADLGFNPSNNFKRELQLTYNWLKLKLSH